MNNSENKEETIDLLLKCNCKLWRTTDTTDRDAVIDEFDNYLTYRLKV